MIATLAALLALLAAASLIGQAVLVASGRNAASPLAPALGLAALCCLAWGTVRLPGEGTAVLIAAGVSTVAAVVVVRRATGIGDLLGAAIPVAVVGALAASLPFVIEGRFGILGTGLNPDMSQHLYATYALVDGGVERLVSSGYPLGPHAVVSGLDALGIGPVQGFAALAIATAVAACVAPLSALSGLSFERRLVGCLLVGLPYMVASYLIQGAFKETLQALFVLAFVIYMAELERGRERGLFVRTRTGEDSALRSGIPLAVLAAGSVYVLSFPALAWLAGTLGLWGLSRLALGASGPAGVLGALRGWVPPTLVGLGVFALLVAPEIGRAVEFARFETFDPDGEGLGNLFNPISPLEGLGIWPSGDFRLDPGAGAVPAIAFWAGAALAAVATLFGLLRTLRRGELALPAAFAVAAALVGYAVLAGTPYQAAKAIALVAPLAMLLAVRELLGAAADLDQVTRLLRRRRVGELAPRRARRARADLAVTVLAASFVAAAGLCSALALANGPIGPDRYDPALRDLAAGLGGGSTLVLAPQQEIGRQHAGDFLTWEFRGNRVCVDSLESASDGGRPPRGVTRVVTVRSESAAAPFAGLRSEGSEGDYEVWVARPAPAGPGPCPYVSDGSRSNPASGAAG